MKARAAVGIAAVAAIAVVAFLVWPRATARAPEAARPGTAPHAAAAAEPRDVSAPGLDAAVDGARVAEAVSPAPAVEPSDRRRWLVRGTVSGVPAQGAQARLRARFVGRYNIEDAVEAELAPDGRVDLDVTPAMQTWLRHADPDELRIEVEHELCMPGLVRLPFASATPDAHDPAAQTFVFELELTTAAVVTGRVVPPSPPAAAALYDLAGTAGAQDAPLARTECAADGRFVLRVLRSGPCRLVALSDRTLPQVRPLELALGRVVDVGTIELGSGAVIEGEVRNGSVPVGAGFLVEAYLSERPRDSRVLNGVLREGYLFELVDGSLLAHRRLVATDADGRFRIEGLAEHEYALEVMGRPDVRMSLGGPSAPELSVRAPRAGVVLARVPPRLEVRPTFAGREPTEAELDGAGLDLVDEGEGHTVAQLELSRALQGYGGIRVLPGVAYGLATRRGRFAERAQTIGPLLPGEEREVVFDLQPGPQPAVLRVRLVAPSGDDPRVAQFALVDLTAPSQDSTTWDERTRGSAGTFEFAGVAAGRLRVLVRPHSRWDDLEVTHWLDDAFEVALAPGETLEHELRLRAGGRVRVAARDDEGAFVRTPVELHDAAGAKLATEFYCRLPGELRGCGWYLCEQGVNDHPPLAPGSYALTLRAEGFAEEVVPFDLAPGETRLLEVTLRRP